MPWKGGSVHLEAQLVAVLMQNTWQGISKRDLTILPSYGFLWKFLMVAREVHPLDPTHPNTTGVQSLTHSNLF